MREPLIVTISADIERPDRVLAGLTIRQLSILTPALALVWLAYLAAGHLLPLPVFAALTIPVLGAVAAFALVQRDGIGLDQLAEHALTYAQHPRRLIPAPDGLPAAPAWAIASSKQAGPMPAPLRLPARAISPRGIIDLGADGIAVVVATTTVSFALRTPTEQAGLVGAFGGWLNSLTGPAQILVQATPIDLSPAITALQEQAADLPHPALEDAALDHAAFLAELATTRDLLARRVLIVIREPTGSTSARTPDTGTSTSSTRGRRQADGAAIRALRRAEQTTRALAAAGIATAVLDGDQAAAVLAAAADPTAPAMSTGMAAPDEPITSTPTVPPRG